MTVTACIHCVRMEIGLQYYYYRLNGMAEGHRHKYFKNSVVQGSYQVLQNT